MGLALKSSLVVYKYSTIVAKVMLFLKVIKFKHESIPGYLRGRINSELFVTRVRVLFSKKFVVNTRSPKRNRQTKSFTSMIILTTVNTSEFKITRLVQSIMWLEMSTKGYVCVFNFQTICVSQRVASDFACLGELI